MTAPTYGIDLGTTCSAIGFVDDGRPRLIEIDGSVLVPSIVSFPEHGEPLVGHPALNRLALDPERTIRSAKRFMGADHRWQVGERAIAPPEVAALVLRKLCDAAGRASGTALARVVVTVPAWFTHGQRADTRKAIELAGLEAVRLINEPTAAALAHAHGTAVRRRALVYDFGGGTFDASVIEQDGDLVEVRASHGDTRLGGDDIDHALAALVLERAERADRGLVDAVRLSVAAKTRLLLAVEAAKVELSFALKTTLRVPFLLDLDGQPRHLEVELVRADVERAAAPLIERTLASVERVLADAGISARDVDELILVGGSTRIPRVWERLHMEYGWEGNSAIPVDCAVALGAAIQGAIIDGGRVDGILVDVAPYSLSVAALDGSNEHMTCQVITPRNSPLPARHTELFQTTSSEQREVGIHVFQGADANPLRNTALCKIEMTDLPPAPRGERSRPIGVEFRHDLDGMVSIRVTDELSGRAVAGRVAADGDEVVELRASLVDFLREFDVVPGDGSDPDPFLELDERDANSAEPVFEIAPAAPPAPLASAANRADSDAAEALRAFDSVLARERELARAHPEAVLELRARASAGRDALDAGREDEGLAHYDALSDLLFELGVYL